jgi:predicted GIY-YIG superfamily endonuclease
MALIMSGRDKGRMQNEMDVASTCTVGTVAAAPTDVVEEDDQAPENCAEPAARPHCQDSEPQGQDHDAEDARTFRGGVYVLANRDNSRTYVGCAGVSFFHRLRQHNREITGGAAATSCSRTWFHALLVTGFADRLQALSFEWYVKKYKWFPPGSWNNVNRRDRLAQHRRKVELLQAKFAASKFPNIVLHDVGPASAHLFSGCACFDCAARGHSPSMRRRIVPTRKPRTTTSGGASV